MFQAFFFIQTEYIARAIAFALWPVLAIFKMLSFLQYQLFFWSRFLHRTTLSCLQKRFLHVLGIFFLSKRNILHELQLLLCGHFWQFLKWFHFSNISCFFEPFFGQKKFNVIIETFCGRFRQFYFFTYPEYFAQGIGFALWPFLTIFKLLSFFQYQLFFRPVFSIEQLECVCRNVFRMSQAILFF